MIQRKNGKINLKKKESSTRESNSEMKSSPTRLPKKSPFSPPKTTYRKVENIRYKKKDT